jgi:hypothetical protein
LTDLVLDCLRMNASLVQVKNSQAESKFGFCFFT